MFDFIAEIIAFFIRPIYDLVQNYGLTIIIFTILIKLATLPFTIKSQKSMARMQQVQPIISEIQRKYANNREKMQEELMKVYDKYEISPTGGCMPMLLQMVILMGFLQIVYKPYTFILEVPVKIIKEAITQLGPALETQAEALNIKLSTITSQQFDIINLPLLTDKIGELMGHEIPMLNLDFFNIDLSMKLSENMGRWECWILPVLALLLTVLSTVISQRNASKKQGEKAKNDAQAQQTAAMTKSMYIMMPLMTAWITYTMPLGCALYWAISTLTQIIQQFLVDQFVVKNMKPIDLNKKKKKPQVKKEVIDVEESSDIKEGE